MAKSGLDLSLNLNWYFYFVILQKCGLCKMQRCNLQFLHKFVQHILAIFMNVNIGIFSSINLGVQGARKREKYGVPPITDLEKEQNNKGGTLILKVKVVLFFYF